MKILSIDVGLINLALVQVECFYDKDILQLDKIINCKLVNLTNLVNKCNIEKCELGHTKTAADYLFHLFKLYKKLFDSSNIILIEKQPPMGLVEIEQIINFQYRNKSVLVHPNSMQSHFKINMYSYEQRKIETTKIAKKYLENIPEYINNDRKHDLSDAVCFVLFYLHKLKSEKDIESEKDRIRKINSKHSIIVGTNQFSKFEYVPDCNKFSKFSFNKDFI